MATDGTKSLLERVLGAHNPFSDAALRNGYELPADVPEIHGEARARLHGLIEDLGRDPRPRMLVVIGEPGDGKTHLLACLRSEAEQSWLQRGHEVALVPVEPLRDLEAPFTHLLRALVAGLSRQLSKVPPVLGSPGSPLELLLWRFILRGAATLVQHPDPAIAEIAGELLDGDLARRPSVLQMMVRDRWEEIEEAMLHEVPRHDPFRPPAVDGEIWSVLCRFPREGLSGLVCRWLGGQSLSDDELRRIGVRDPIDDEERSLRALRTLLNLSDVPIVLGLDQLEGVRRLGESAVKDLFEALTVLYGEGGRLLVMLFCQAQVWAELQRNVERQALDRLEAPLILSSLSPELGEKLIACRLAPIWRSLGETPPHPTAPYPLGFVRRTIEVHSLRQPRRLLSYFARLGLTDSPPVEPAEPVGIAPPPRPDGRSEARRSHRQIVERLRGEPPPTPEDRASITEAALADLIQRAVGRQLAGVQVIAGDRVTVRRRSKPGLRAKLSRGGKDVTLYAEASNQDNGRAAMAIAERMKEALHKKVADRALLVREEGMPLPRGAASAIEELGSRASVVYVPASEQVDLAAVEKLLNAAAAQDIDVDEASAAAYAVDELGPALVSVQRFLDAAFGTGSGASDSAASGDARRMILEAVAAPPHVVTEAQIAERSGLPIDTIASAVDRLEEQGEITAYRDREGKRAVLKKPK